MTSPLRLTGLNRITEYPQPSSKMIAPTAAVGTFFVDEILTRDVYLAQEAAIRARCGEWLATNGPTRP